MCYAIPGKVESIDKKIVTVDYFGEKKKAINELEGLKIGDFIYAQGGYVINILKKEEAEDILLSWKETFFELQETDLRLSRIDSEKNGMNPRTVKILDKALENIELKYEELLYLMHLEDKNDLSFLYKVVNFLRQKYLGNSCCVHGIIEFSNYCRRDCYYCGISSINPNVKRYRMSADELVAAATEAINGYNFKALVLQSGEDPGYSVDMICDVIRRIKKVENVLIFVSVGETGITGLEKMYEAGARGLLLRFETSNQALYEELHPGYSLATRIAHIEAAYGIGYLVVTGGLIGLPGQTGDDIVNDILLTKKLNAEMYSYGPFIPHPDTPLKNSSIIGKDEVLKTLAISRIVDPQNAKILVTTAFETLNIDARKEGLMAGANSVMLNVTPEIYRKSYEIYPNKAYINDSIQKQIDETLGLLRNMGRAPTDIGIK
jgi:biotin synthase